MQEQMKNLTQFLQGALTPYHAQESARELLLNNGFTRLYETDDWNLCEGGKYFVEREGALLAFTVGAPDNFSYKIAASHLDSPALKLKENAEIKAGGCVTLNVETYGGGIWYSFFDRPLKIAGRVVKSENGRVYSETVTSPYFVTIPSVAIHQNRNANEGFSVNPQTDLLPIVGLDDTEYENFLTEITSDGRVLAYDLFVVSATEPYFFGKNEEFLASPRVDNLTSVYASLEGLCAHANSDGVAIVALFNNEEIGSGTTSGAGGDFLEITMKRIAYALRFDESEYFKALSSSFLLSVDNAHALHPNHPEKSDPTNKVKAGGGVVIKSHANGAYITDATSCAIVKTIFEKAGVPSQTFFNRSDARSGSTLGKIALQRTHMKGADIGLAQYAMHSACESFAVSDYLEMVNAITAFFSSDLRAEEDGFIIR